MGWFKSMLTNAAIKLLNIQPAIPHSIFHNITFKRQRFFYYYRFRYSRLYRGDPSELDQFFKGTIVDQVSRSRFWAAVPSEKLV